MLKAFGRFLKALGHKIGGIFGRKTEKLMQDADTMKGAYQDVIDEKKGRIQEYMKAVGEMSAQNERRVSRVKKLTEEIQHLEKVKAGALGKAQQHQADLQSQGKTADEISHDEMMLKLRAAFADASSTLTSKQEQIAQIEGEIADAKKRIGSHKVQLQTMQREIAKLKEESSEAVADVKSAQFEKSIADTLAGISEDSTDQTLEMLRSTRDNARGQAAIAREVAGNDAGALENELAAFGADSAGASEFDQLLGGGSAAPAVEADVELDLGTSKS